MREYFFKKCINVYDDDGGPGGPGGPIGFFLMFLDPAEAKCFHSCKSH